MDFKMQFSCYSAKYYPLRKSSMSSSITNTTQQKMHVTKVGLNFDWMGDGYCESACNIEVAPGATVTLPPVPFTLGLEASEGTHSYKAGVVYELLTGRGWERYWEHHDITYVTQEKHVMVTKAPRRDFEVFISHTNSDEDTLLLERTTESFEKCGIRPYVAELDPKPGSSLWQKIEAAIRRADAVLILWTENGSHSGDIKVEMGIAIGANKAKAKRIITLVQGDLKMHGSLSQPAYEYVPLDINKPFEALSIAVSRAIEWAAKKEQDKPKIVPFPEATPPTALPPWIPKAIPTTSWIIPPKSPV